MDDKNNNMPDEETLELVRSFEAAMREGRKRYFDVDEMEIVIDYYLNANDLQNLEDAVRYAERLFPEATGIRLRQAHLMCAKSMYDKALPLLRELLRIEPDNTDVHYALGAVYGAMGQPNKAIQHYLFASRDKYCLDTIYGNVGDEYRNLEREEEAIHYYKKSLMINPEEERSLQNLIQCYDVSNRLIDGEKFLSDFVQKHPDSVMGWYGLGNIYYYLSLYEKAVDALEYALAIDKSYVDAYRCLASCYLEMGNAAQAAQTMHEALPHSKNPEQIYHSIGAIYFDEGNYRTAAFYFRKALEIDAQYGESMRWLAICYNMQGDHATAAIYIERAIAAMPPLADYHYDAAIIHAANMDVEQAASHFERAIDLDSTQDKYWIDYATLLYSCQEYEHAISLLESGLETAEDSKQFDIIIAACHLKLGHRGTFEAMATASQARWSDWNELLLQLCPEAIAFLPM